MNEKIALETKMDSVLKEWDLKMTAVLQKAAIVKPEKKAAYDQFTGVMKTKLAETKAHLADLHRANGQWKEVAGRLEKAWAEFVAAYSKAIIQFEGMIP